MTQFSRNQFDGCPLPGSLVYVPKSVELIKGVLLFDPKERRESEQNRMQNAGALGRFINLFNKPDSEVLEFARQWGVLDFCKHRLPFTHSRDNWFDKFPYWKEACLPAGEERISRWKTIARQFRSVLEAVASLKQRKRGSEEKETGRMSVKKRISG